MNSGREQILAKLRAKRDTSDAAEQAARQRVAERIQHHAPVLIPARGLGDKAELLARFQQMATEAIADVSLHETETAALAAIADQLQQQGITSLVTTADAQWQQHDWASQGIQCQVRPAQVGDHASLTPCLAGIAETGTLMITSAPHHPTTLHFLPDWHLVMLRSSQIVGSYEDAWTRLRQQNQQTGGMPRTVNMITGASRSADIEQRLQMGAHGPKRLIIFIVMEN
ncbi:hypothetical protein WH50_20445 [Pokkaliibacter plantistimulans]|uniref:LUD domain-containing protein n=1 Tax=Pokkaliibacter plantistimulans TaxID=1635171 RepID=A0ABX5LW39_9GAMM|nr:LUD domain-containing protein [Pokkaliibacter plantistimulans]PXF29511.1 hypothetical protein WH50_20445 [Pokkaliibacter plantistimulans]